MSKREAIGQRVKDMLLDRTPAGQKITINTAEPDEEPTTPTLAIFTTEERRGEFEENGDASFSRIVNVEIDVKVAEPSSDGASTRINAICDAVEDALMVFPQLRAADNTVLADRWRWNGWKLTVSADSRRIVNGATVSMEAEYVFEPERQHRVSTRPLTQVHVQEVVGGQPKGMASDIDLAGG